MHIPDPVTITVNLAQPQLPDWVVGVGVIALLIGIVVGVVAAIITSINTEHSTKQTRNTLIAGISAGLLAATVTIICGIATYGAAWARWRQMTGR